MFRNVIDILVFLACVVAAGIVIGYTAALALLTFGGIN